MSETKVIETNPDGRTVLYVNPNFRIGTDEGSPDLPVSISIQRIDLSEYTDIDAFADAQVMVLPGVVTDRAWSDLTSGMEHEYLTRDTETIGSLAAMDGMGAHVTRFAAGISFPHVQDGPNNLAAALDAANDTEDLAVLDEWIDQYGARVAETVAGMIGFALDGPQNRIGETGWDWTLRYMIEDYTSETVWPRRMGVG